jgi:hypothetical protein
MYKQSIFSARTTKLAMVETRLEMRHFLQKGFHVRGVPQEASCRVLKREENTVSMTQSAKLLSDFIQIVGCLNTGLQIWAQSRKAIWKLVCPQNGWVVSKTAFDETRSGSSAAWRCKMNVDTSVLLN